MARIVPCLQVMMVLLATSCVTQGFGSEVIGKEVVNRNSSYCDWTSAMGPICIYNDTDKVSITNKLIFGGDST